MITPSTAREYLGKSQAMALERDRSCGPGHDGQLTKVIVLPCFKRC